VVTEAVAISRHLAPRGHLAGFFCRQ